MHYLLSGWGLDGPAGAYLSALTLIAGALYLALAAQGTRRDRRGRRWPARRSACWVAGLAILLIDVDGRIGTGADTRLTDHVIEHMVIWLVVAPLLVAAAPLRLALFAISSPARRRLAGCLHSRPVRAITSPLGSTGLFAALLIVTQTPPVYALTLDHDVLHVSEHALYLVSAMLVWAPVIGADPLPHRPGPRVRALCQLGCTAPMVLISVVLLAAGAPLYAHQRLILVLTGALRDQHRAGLIMLLAGIPALVAPVLMWARPTPSPRRIGTIATSAGARGG